MLKCTFMPIDAYHKAEAARQDAVHRWRESHNLPSGDPWPDELRRLSDGFVPPGAMWFCPWYFDPAKAGSLAKIPERIASIEANPNTDHHLSIHYWRDHAHLRPPICVKAPNGHDWIVDTKSSNSSGWQVRGEPPLLEVSPSIDVPGYHGFLGSHGAPPGYFSDPL